MQCQGRTRSGLRCRNKALPGELFCDIHMRVNHSHNLTLLIPLLIGIFSAYFFFFGLLFNTVVFGVFDINYLAFAGIEDLFLNMLRFGAITTLFIFVIWTLYVVLLTLVFALILLVHMIRATSGGGLTFLQRLKVIGLSFMVFCLNVLMMLIIRFPARNRWHLTAMAKRRENFARSLFDLKTKSAPVKRSKPVLSARDTFKNFLTFRNLANHRFFATILLLFITSLVITYHAGSEAEYARACSMLHKEKTEAKSFNLFPVPALMLEEPCSLADKPDTVDNQQMKKAETSLTETFILSLARFFDFTPVTLQAFDGQINLLHLSSTSRFDLFFNGQSGKSLAVPRGGLLPFYGESENEGVQPSVQMIERQIQRLQEKVQASSNTLFNLNRELKRNTEKLDQIDRSSLKDEKAAASKDHVKNGGIPEHCWRRPPDDIIPFITSSASVENAGFLDRLAKLSIRYRKNQKLSVVITGFADTTGPIGLNQYLSEQRARTISQIFEKLGIDPNRIFPVGMGENVNDTLPPRRVEIRSCRLY